MEPEKQEDAEPQPHENAAALGMPQEPGAGVDQATGWESATSFDRVTDWEPGAGVSWTADKESGARSKPVKTAHLNWTWT